MEKYKIDEVAKESGLTKRAIRYYEEIGILPAPERSEGGIRLYTQEHIDHLKKLITAKEVLGFSLQELHQYISLSNDLDEHKHDFRQATDQTVRRNKLTDIDRTLTHQLAIMQQKILNIQTMQIELEDLRIRVRKAIARIDDNSGKES